MRTGSETKQHVLDMENGNDKGGRAVFYAYKRMFEVAGGDFIQLIKDGKINERGEVEIPFMDYSISENEFDAVIDETTKKFKLKGWQKKSLRNETLLGCSPKFKE